MECQILGTFTAQNKHFSGHIVVTLNFQRQEMDFILLLGKLLLQLVYTEE